MDRSDLTYPSTSDLPDLSIDKKLEVLTVPDYNLIANKSPNGCYDRITRNNLYWIIEKLTLNHKRLSSLERRLLEKFGHARFSPLEDKNKRMMFEVAWYRLYNGAKQSFKLVLLGTISLVALSWTIYQLAMDTKMGRKMEAGFSSGLNGLGLASHEKFEVVQKDLTATSQKLAETEKSHIQLNQRIEQMIVNNQVTDNFKHILKQIYLDPRTNYVTKKDRVSLVFDGQEIASYKTDPDLWYMVGVIESGMFRVYYDDEEILEIETIFGRVGTETPTGEYKIVNKVFKPTWYTKVTTNGKTRVRAIPFGHKDHDIGRWWMGIKSLDPSTKGSYGIHGVNVQKVNEFFKKNFDWRNGSAGCLNIQGWYLQFLGKVVPVGAHVNIVKNDKWRPEPKVSTLSTP